MEREKKIRVFDGIMQYDTGRYKDTQPVSYYFLCRLSKSSQHFLAILVNKPVYIIYAKNPGKVNKQKSAVVLTVFPLHNVNDKSKQTMLSLYVSLYFLIFYLSEISGYPEWRAGECEREEFTKEPQEAFGSDGYVHELDYSAYMSKHTNCTLQIHAV